MSVYFQSYAGLLGRIFLVIFCVTMQVSNVRKDVKLWVWVTQKSIDPPRTMIFQQYSLQTV